MSNVDVDYKSFEKHSDTRPIPVCIVQTIDSRDEVSLIDVWRVIAKRRTIIVASVLLSVLVAFGYLIFAESVYTARAGLLPPQHKDIQGLLVGYRGGEEDIGVERYTPESVYSAFLDNLNSQGVRREFFEARKLLQHYVSGDSAADINVDRVFDELFSDRLRVLVDKQNKSFVTVSFSDSDPKLAAQLLNQYINFADRRTVDQLFNDINAAVQSQINLIIDQLDIKLKSAEQRRSDRVTVLREALSVAKALGIKDASTSFIMADKTQTGLAVNTAQLPLYTRGADALEAEIAVLESRKSDQPFIAGLRDLQERRAFLEGVSIDLDALSATIIDAIARVPYRAEKPRKFLLMSIAATLGLVIGLILVFAAEFRSKNLGEYEKPNS